MVAKGVIIVPAQEGKRARAHATEVLSSFQLPPHYFRMVSLQNCKNAHKSLAEANMRRKLHPMLLKEVCEV
jgi:hypothetical protein